MMGVRSKISWMVFVIFAIAIGCYPLIYAIADMHDKGLMQSKPPALLHNAVWETFFYIHISFGGLALLTGWQQFSVKLRQKYLEFHRWLGRIYVIAVLMSGTAGLYIAYYASGGLISTFGFGLLAFLWLFTNMKGYLSILKGDVPAHRKWMIRNYSLTFAAVTLRIWLPVLLAGFKMEFLTAYPIVAWLCWVPNLIITNLFFVKSHRNASDITASISTN